jgi:hypothetical protein
MFSNIKFTMSSTTSSSNLTSGFIDLATFDELEKYMYGGDTAVSYFVRKVRKATWFTIVPVVLSKSSGIAQFNQQWSANISRAGDYLLRSFLRITVPAVQISASNRFGANGSLRWTRNLMHSLIKECSITFNDLVEMRFDNYYLDFWSQFTIPAGKINGYHNMIGNIDELTNPGNIGVSVPVQSLPQITLNLPLPLCHARDTGVALPTAALPYNEMRINFNFRDWSELLIIDNIVTGVSTNAQLTDIQGSAPQLQQVDVWAEYAIVSNNERKQMGQAPRDILIEQVQTVPTIAFNPTNALSNTDIRLSHAVKALFFAVRNKTNPAEWSNYTAASPFPGVKGVTFSPALAADPINTASLLYENTQRLSNMGADYFALVNPWYNAVSIPQETGYHMYSYTLDLMSVNPMASTNFGKLTNVSLQLTPSLSAQTAGTSTGTLTTPNTALVASGAGLQQIFEFVLVAVNHNIIRVAGGALGFPVL